MKRQEIIIAFLIAVAFVIGIDLITNSLDIVKYTWDFKYYINMTVNGFKPDPLLIGPYVYRYPTPLLAGQLVSNFHLSVEAAYKTIAYAGAILQLFSIYLISFHFSKNKQIAYACMFIAAFTFMNVKFLMFDVYRPDHLAYALVTLSVYFALTKKYFPLLLTACIAVQFREFGILPLFSYWLFMLWKKDWKQIIRWIIPTGVFLFAAVVLPRLLITVHSTMQFISADSGVMRTIKYLLSPKRNFNILYDSIAYFLPVWILFSKERFERLKQTGDFFKYLVCYIFFVLSLTFIGGGDIQRFVTFYFIAVALIVTTFLRDTSVKEIVIMLAAVFIFNRIWMQIPMESLDRYLDLMSGNNTRVNLQSLLRVIELSATILIARFLIHKTATEKSLA